jgi:hypothetical protein
MQGINAKKDSVSAVYDQVCMVQTLDFSLYTQFTLLASTCGEGKKGDYWQYEISDA